jgi:hypothetical protein
MKPKELTVRGLILGALITTVFTAANVYLGLKVGLTFAPVRGRHHLFVWLDVAPVSKGAIVV